MFVSANRLFILAGVKSFNCSMSMSIGMEISSAKKLWLELRVMLYIFFSRNAMCTIFLQQILSVTYDLSWKCCERNTSFFLGSRVKYLFHKFYFFLVRICSINLHTNICFQCYNGVHFLDSHDTFVHISSLKCININ